MPALDFEAIAKAAGAACDRARQEIVPRFRSVAVETKADGSPVTEADRAAELLRGTPDEAQTVMLLDQVYRRCGDAEKGRSLRRLFSERLPPGPVRERLQRQL